MASRRSGGDPPDQSLLTFVERLLPRGSALRKYLTQIGIVDPDVSRKLERAGVSVVPNGEKPSKASRNSRPEATEPPPTCSCQTSSSLASPAPPTPPHYVDEITSETTIAGLFRRIRSRKRTGPTPLEEFSIWKMVIDFWRHYHLAKALFGLAVSALALIGFPRSAGVPDLVKPPPPAKEVPLFPQGTCTKVDGSPC